MSHNPILPYYYPTTVLMVDDNQRFLENFSMQLDEQLAVVFDNSARRALEFIHDRQNAVPLDQRCFSWQNSNDSDANVFRLDVALIEQEISNPRRYADLSVVIVDYDMPEMLGLEFCEQINNTRLKKILLTGVGDEKVAVSAFNDGIIDRFLLKSDPDITRKINQTIADLQRQYFSEVSRFLQGSLMLKSPEFLFDQAFSDYFFTLLRRLNIVEYYYVEDPDGFLLVSESGELKRLLVHSEKSLQKSLFRINRFNPPDAVRKDIGRGKLVPWLWSSPDDFDEDDPFDWQEFLHPATRIQSRQDWYCALAENPPADIEFNSNESSYLAYLEELDNRSKRS